jgi:hypothetical protein
MRLDAVQSFVAGSIGVGLMQSAASGWIVDGLICQYKGYAVEQGSFHPSG